MVSGAQAKLLHLYFIWVCGVSAYPLSSDKDQQRMYTINILFRKLEEMQVEKSTESSSVFTPARYQGVYESEWNLIPDEPASFIDQRTVISIKDTDIFANTWITVSLIEAYLYGRSPKPTEEHLNRSICSLKRFIYKTDNISSSRVTIWPQEYDLSLKVWTRGPVNLMRLGKLMTGEKVERLARGLGTNDLRSIIRRLTFSKELFNVPPDFGSTFANIGLGSVLRSMEENFVGAYDTWKSTFAGFDSVMTSLKHHAYRPFSSTRQTSNVVDSRTYFVLRKFLEAAKEEQKDIVLVPIWNTESENHDNGFSQATRQIKTIDVTASAIVLFGLTNMVLTEMVSPDILADPDIEAIFRNTSSMLTFLISTNFSGRPDIALTYHPSEFHFYWSVARTLSILRRHISRHGLYHQTMVAVLLELKDVLQGPCTDRILSSAATIGPDQVYFEDYNTTRETRLFSTAMAMNTILSTWTVFDEGSGYLVWEEYTPAELIVTMERAATWLNRNILGDKYRPGNELLSWQRRGVHHDTLPANVCMYVNGTKSAITPRSPCVYSLTSIRAVQGVVSADSYQDQFESFRDVGRDIGNGDNLVWSSQAVTYASSMYALSCHYNTIAYDEAYRRL